VPWGFSSRRAVLHDVESIPPEGEVSLKGLSASVKAM
jgi:hypothetical protein